VVERQWRWLTLYPIGKVGKLRSAVCIQTSGRHNVNIGMYYDTNENVYESRCFYFAQGARITRSNTLNRLWARRLPRNRHSILGRGKRFPVLHGALIGCEAHPVPFPMRTAVPSPDLKRPRREPDLSPLSSADVKNGWSYTSAPLYVFMGWCLSKHRDNYPFRNLCNGAISEYFRVLLPWRLRQHDPPKHR
jgi:hypothetical protein